MFGTNFVDHPHFTGLRIRILVQSHVLLRHFVDVVIRALLGNLDHRAANFQVTVRIVRIDNGQRNPRITAKVAVFLTPFGRVDEDKVTFDIIFLSRADYDRVRLSGALSREAVARIYNLAPGRISDYVEFDPALAIKFTIR